MASQDPLLVRFGVRYLHKFAGGKRPDVGDGIHVLNEEERRRLRRTERNAILRAALAGAISTLIAAAVEVAVTRPLLGHRPKHASLEQQIHFYAVVGLATLVTSVIEILFLYWDALRSVHRLAHDAGFDLFPDQDDDKAVAGAMARAALELPNPTAQLFGVDPRRETSRAWLVVASLAYKLKTSATNFLVKALVRRALGRAVVRSWLPFVAVPFTAGWNAVVAWLIMREARIRAMGPSAIREMLDIAFRLAKDPLSAEAKTCALRAVASSIVRTEDLHPNLAELLREVATRIGAVADDAGRLVAGADLDDTKAFLASLDGLQRHEQATALRILAIASIIDGRLARNERRLVAEARKRCGLSDDLSSVHALRRAFLDGEILEDTRIARLSEG